MKKTPPKDSPERQQRRERLRQAIAAAGFRSPRQFALSMDLSTSTVAGHLNGQNDIREDAAKEYGRLLGVSWLWLLHGTGSATPSPEDLGTYALMGGRAGPALNNILPTPNALVGDKVASLGKAIPVYGSAVGGIDGEFDMNGSLLYEVMAPPVLNEVSNAYAVIVSGDSMEPAFFDGYTCFVDPSRRVTKGDFVVVQIQREEHGARLAYVKRFVRHNSEELVLEQFNPPKQLRFPHEQVVSVHYIALAGRI